MEYIFSQLDSVRLRLHYSCHSHEVGQLDQTGQDSRHSHNSFWPQSMKVGVIDVAGGPSNSSPTQTRPTTSTGSVSPRSQRA